MRLAAYVVLAGCGFSAPVATDAPLIDAPDAMDALDVQQPVAWTVDTASGKATPQTAGEWADFIGTKGLAIAVPDSLWLMQEASGALTDSIGSVTLNPFGFPMYRQPVPGWSRQGITTLDGTGTGFLNTTAAALPDVSTTSMTLMMFYASGSAPSLGRSVSFSGGGVPSAYGELTLEPSSRLKLTVGSNSATGTDDHGTAVHPVMIKLDRRASVQQVITDLETITPTYTPLTSSRGIILGGASKAAPDGRWIYMVGWFGTNAEISAPEAAKLVTALGW